jgi:hypothetical protein
MIADIRSEVYQKNSSKKKLNFPFGTMQFSEPVCQFNFIGAAQTT